MDFSYFGVMFKGVTGWGVLMLALIVFLAIGIYFGWQWWRKKHPKQDTDASFVVAEETVNGVPLEAKAGRFPSMIWTENDGIKWGKIPERIGYIGYNDTSLPHSGASYMVRVDKNGYRAYDPRDDGLSEVSPGKLYRATRVKNTVQTLFTSLTGLWEKINMILMYCSIGGGLLVALVGIDALAKR